jgi:hypothetical protein
MPVGTQTTVSTSGSTTTVTVTVRDMSGGGGNATSWDVEVILQPGCFLAPTNVAGTMTAMSAPTVTGNSVKWTNQALAPNGTITGSFDTQLRTAVAAGSCCSIDSTFDDQGTYAGTFTEFYQHNVCKAQHGTAAPAATGRGVTGRNTLKNKLLRPGRPAPKKPSKPKNPPGPKRKVVAKKR